MDLIFILIDTIDLKMNTPFSSNICIDIDNDWVVEVVIARN